jgi:hypothetical protein
MLVIWQYGVISTKYRRHMVAKKKDNMRKTTIQLSEEQYFFLKEKSLSLQKQRKNYSIVSIIRDLIDDDRKKWNSKG